MFAALYEKYFMLDAKLTFLLISFIAISTYGVCQHEDLANPNQNSNHQNLTLARSFIENNKEDSSMIYLNAILSKTYNHEEALTLRAKVYSNQQNYDKALVDYNALAEIKSEDREIWYARALVRQQLAQYALAIEDFQKVLHMQSRETETAYFKMNSKGNLALSVTTMNDMEPEIWNNIGLCYYQTGNYPQAIKAYKNAINEDQNSIDSYLNRAVSYEKTGAIDSAINDYKYVLSKVPNHAIATYNMINLEKNDSNDIHLLNSLNAYITENPSSAEGYESRGLYYFEIQNFDLAEKDFIEATNINPLNLDYLFNLALTLEKANKPAQAEKLFIKVTELDPGHSGAYFNLGNIEHRSSRYPEAIAYYTLAINLNPQNISILYNRALAYHENKQNKEACADMGKVMIADKNLADGFYTKFCSGEK